MKGMFLSLLAVAGAATVTGGAEPLNYQRKATRAETVAATLAATKGAAPGDLKFGPWQVIGPFDFAGEGDFDRIYPPEKEIALDREYIGKSGAAAKWRAAPQFRDAAANNLRQFFNDENVCAYVYRMIESPTERELTVYLGSDDGLAVWLNGQKRHAANLMRPLAPDSDRVVLPLKKGMNHLLMKITQGGGQWEFWFRPSPLTAEQEAELARRLERDFPDPKALEARYYRVTRLEEPAGVVLEVGGMDFGPDGKLYICTRRGEVWAISNPTARDPKQVQWTLFASGLHEALGLTVDRKSGDVYVIERPQITRLRDTNRDGAADVYENFCDDWGVSGQYHEFAFGFGRDKQEHLYIALNVDFQVGHIGGSRVPWRGWVLKITPQGKAIPFAVGCRSPDGIGNSLDGEIFYTDNQGDYVETGGLWHVKQQSFFGHPAGLVWRQRAWPDRDPFPGLPRVAKFDEMKDLPTELLEKYRQRPAVWFPYGRMGQSTGQPVADSTRGRFGPFAGQLFVGDQQRATVMRVSLEKVRGEFQGACFPFRSGFDCGVHRGAFGPDGSLFVGQTERGWGSVGPKSWGLQRVQWLGETPFEIAHVGLKPHGFDLTFTKEVDAETARDPKAYNLAHFFMRYRQNYGSPEEGQTHVTVESVALSSDRKTVSLKIPEIVRNRVYEFTLSGVRAADGAPLVHREAYYTVNQLP